LNFYKKAVNNVVVTGRSVYFGITIGACARKGVTKKKGGHAMGILSWIILGLVVGVIAKFLMPGKDPGGIFITIILGIAGAVGGGFISSAIGFGKVTGFDLRSLIIAVGGSIILLAIYRAVKK